ncbi:FUSC family protein [Brevibacillus daliensis]|uniref:FUSC family protein n=1 Tax=Brevibacillus daliensis TaxID=2892995 RepID=UPI001E5E9EC9|nr:FUSC family protein [Brevibacillus daliensis]
MVKRSLRWCARFGLTFHVCKIVLASGVSWFLASMLFGNEFAYFAPLSTVLVMQLTIVDTLEKGIYRVVGIIGGVLSSLIILPLFDNSLLGLILVLLLGMSTATAIGLNPQIVSQIGVSSVMIMTFQQMQGYATGRILETMIGAIVAVLIQTLIRPENHMPITMRLNSDVCSRLANLISQLALYFPTIENRTTRMHNPSSLLSYGAELNESLVRTKKSLKYNLFYRKDWQKVQMLEIQVATIQRMVIGVGNLVYSLPDVKKQNVGSNVSVLIMEALTKTSECVALYGSYLEQPTSRKQDDLFSKLQVLKLTLETLFAHCAKETDLVRLREIGSIFSDLERIISEIEQGSIATSNYLNQSLLPPTPNTQVSSKQKYPAAIK